MSVSQMAASLPVAVSVVTIVKNSIESLKLWFDVRDRFGASRKLSQQSLQDTAKLPAVISEGNAIGDLVSEDILSAIQRRIESCKVEYARVLGSPDQYSESSVDAESRAYIACICRNLNRLYHVNKRIPDGELKRFWESYSCNTTSQF